MRHQLLRVHLIVAEDFECVCRQRHGARILEDITLPQPKQIYQLSVPHQALSVQSAEIKINCMKD